MKLCVYVRGRVGTFGESVESPKEERFQGEPIQNSQGELRETRYRRRSQQKRDGDPLKFKE